jgi:hypothetical protein
MDRPKFGSGSNGPVGFSVETTHVVWGLKRCVLGREVLFGVGVGAESVEVFEGEDLLREDLAELACDVVGDLLKGGDGDAFEDFEVEAGYGLICDAAGINELEVAQVCGDVEGEAVGGDSAGDMDADGADFSFVGRAWLCRAWLVVVKSAPDPGESSDTAGADAINSAEADQGFFHHANEIDGTEATAACILETAEIEDGVADELSGAVISDVAAAVDFVQGDTAAGEEFVRSEDVGAAGVAAEGEDRGMFEE